MFSVGTVEAKIQTIQNIFRDVQDDFPEAYSLPELAEKLDRYEIEFRSIAYEAASFCMALGIKVLIILVVAYSFGLGIAILPAAPQTANAYNCFAVTHECLETRDPVDLMTKMFPDMLPRYG